MRKFFIRLSIPALVILAGCHHQSLADRATQEAKEYTERYCPTPVIDFQRTDSVTFDESTLSFNYYYTLVGKADDKTIIKDLLPKLKNALLSQLIENTKAKAYKEAGFNFHYIFRSEKNGEVLIDETICKEHYAGRMPDA